MIVDKAEDQVLQSSNGIDDNFEHGISIDQIIDKSLKLCDDLSPRYVDYKKQIEELRDRLSKGKLHFAVLGQFNRGKSTFVNALLGMKVLPTSTLPLTNVPTIIRYGRKISCTVSFFNGKENAVACNSPEVMQQLLIKYVTEENNPKNQHCVDTVYVDCPSELVQNGTVLIDTPGFGSTFVHNTKTTVDLLCECDAAFFLLSADLPITEVEVQFLKQVCKYVPRLFFIFNKIDLLNEQERTRTNTFVRAEVRKHLKLPTEINLFPINARLGESAEKQDPEDQAWEQSGMIPVMETVNRFMLSDKYFILSRALNEKFLDALDGIIETLGSEINDISSPVSELYEIMLLIKDKVVVVEQQTGTELKMVDAEKGALQEFLSKTIEQNRKSLLRQVEQFFDQIVDQEKSRISVADRLIASFPSFFNQSLKTSILQITSAINKPLRKASLIHRREFERIAKEAERLLSIKINLSEAMRDTLEGLEITPPFESIPPDSFTDLDRLSTSFSDRFKNKASLRKVYESRYLPVFQGKVETSCKEISGSFQKQIESACIELSAELNNSYTNLKHAAEGKLREKESLWQNAHEKAKPLVEKKEDLQEEFNKIKDMLP